MNRPQKQTQLPSREINPSALGGESHDGSSPPWHAFIHSFIQQTLPEDLLCAGPSWSLGGVGASWVRGAQAPRSQRLSWGARNPLVLKPYVRVLWDPVTCRQPALGTSSLVGLGLSWDPARSVSTSCLGGLSTHPGLDL